MRQSSTLLKSKYQGSFYIKKYKNSIIHFIMSLKYILFTFLKIYIIVSSMQSRDHNDKQRNNVAKSIRQSSSRICAIICIVCSVASIVILVSLIILSDSKTSITSFSLYGSFLILFYIITSIYHFFPFGFTAKKVFFRLTHAFFITNIIGVYIPLCLIALKGAWGWTFLGIIIGLGALGIILRAVFTYRWRGATETVYYFTINWLWLIAIPRFIEVLGEKAMVLYLIGFLILNISMVFYRLSIYEVNKRYILFMPLFYFFLIVSNVCHAIFMFIYLA